MSHKGGRVLKMKCIWCFESRHFVKYRNNIWMVEKAWVLELDQLECEYLNSGSTGKGYLFIEDCNTSLLRMFCHGKGRNWMQSTKHKHKHRVCMIWGSMVVSYDCHMNLVFLNNRNLLSHSSGILEASSSKSRCQ